MGDCSWNNNYRTWRKCEAVGAHAPKQRTLECSLDAASSKNEKVEGAAHGFNVIDNKVANIAAQVKKPESTVPVSSDFWNSEIVDIHVCTFAVAMRVCSGVSCAAEWRR